MKECDILGDRGLKTYIDPAYIFSGDQDPLIPKICAPGADPDQEFSTEFSPQRDIANCDIFLGPSP